MEKGFIFSLIFAAIIAIFALNNSGAVMIDLFFTEIELSQAIVILASALFGAIVVAIISGVRSLKHRSEKKKLETEIEDYRLRNQELSDTVVAKDAQIKSISRDMFNAPEMSYESKKKIQEDSHPIVADPSLDHREEL